MEINGTVYVKGNVGLLIQKDGMASLIEYTYTNLLTTSQKTIRQWYANEVVYDYFATTTSRDSYFDTNPSELVTDMYIYVNNIGIQKYIDIAWVTQINPVTPSTVSDGITEIINARNSEIYAKYFPSLDSRLENIESQLTDKQMQIQTITDDITLNSKNNTVLVDATNKNIIVTLPTAIDNKYLYCIKKIDSSTNTVTINTTDSQTIDGISTYTINIQYNAINVISNNNNWFIINKSIIDGYGN